MRKRDAVGVALLSGPRPGLNFSCIFVSVILFVNVDKQLRNFNQAEGNSLKLFR
jgi:hypothetical protein